MSPTQSTVTGENKEGIKKMAMVVTVYFNMDISISRYPHTHLSVTFELNIKNKWNTQHI